MQILIMNGTPDTSFRRFDSYISDVAKALQAKHTISVLTLRDENIRACTGCHFCWINHPGQCIFDDAMTAVYRQYLRVNLVLFCSPIIMGFTSSLVTQATERLLPLLHPHYEIANGELRHKARYESYPKIGLLLGQTPESDKDDIKIITDIYRRIASFLHTTLVFTRTSADGMKEVVNAINCI